MRLSKLPVARSWRVVRHLARWSRISALFLAFAAWDWVRGRASPRRRGARLRRLLEGAGGTALLLGRQFAVRIDLFSIAFCQELRLLEDRGDGMPLEHVVARIERAAGRPMDEVFERFDPEPVACYVTRVVYQAVLRSGERVAVQVRRPKVGEALDADLRALGILFFFLEWTTILPRGNYAAMRRDMGRLLAEEIDFVRRAQVTRMFRRWARKDRVRFASASRIYGDPASDDILVNEFVGGYYLYELLDAVEGGDEEALAAFAREGIHPEQVARRLLQTYWWGIFENLFFFTNPHPTNVVVQPGGRIVLLDFAETAGTSHRLRRIHHQFIRALERGDVTTATDLMIRSIQPLPFIDVDELAKKVESRFWHHYFALRSRRMSHPLDRTFASPWLSFLEIAREFGIVVQRDTLRMIHTAFLYGTLAARLWPEIPASTFWKYEKRAFRRKARNHARAQSRMPLPTPLSDLDGQARQLERNVLWTDVALSDGPVTFMAIAGKGAYTASVVLRLLLLAAGFVFLIGVAGVIARPGLSTWQFLREAASHPVVIAGGLVAALVAFRLIFFRLADLDPHVRSE